MQQISPGKEVPLLKATRIGGSEKDGVRPGLGITAVFQRKRIKQHMCAEG